MAVFFKKKSYDQAMQQIATLNACPYTGVVTADQVKIILGELLDIWPDSIADDE
jgi:hypothetical protein